MRVVFCKEALRFEFISIFAPEPRISEHVPREVRNEMQRTMIFGCPPDIAKGHGSLWGKPWPQSEGTIFDDETGSVDDDEIPGLADKLEVPPLFHYRYFKEIQDLKSALGASPGQEDLEGVLVIREEYEILRRALEDDLKVFRDIAVTGHPGIGSYESWFSSLESNADFSPILRQEHLPPLPPFTSSREQTSNGSPIWCQILLHL
jgi:hypothetical protein